MQRFLRTTVMLAMALALVLPASSAFAQGTKVAYVNLQAALNRVEEGKRVKKKLKRELEKRQKKLNSQQQKVKKMRSEFEAQAAMMNDTAKRKKLEELQRELFSLQKMYFGMQEELSKREAEATKKIFDKMRKIVASIAKERKLDIVLETNASVVYGDPGLDLTPELVRRYNK